jgi:hypothetical protein
MPARDLEGSLARLKYGSAASLADADASAKRGKGLQYAD